MDWVQVLVIVGANLGVVIPLFLHSDSKMESHRRESAEILKGIREDMKDFHEAMKDFHGRLCAIEERRMRILEK